MRKIENIFTELPGYHCFGCSPKNDHGLQLEFKFDENENCLVTELAHTDHFHGFPDILHGGIQATIMDECGFWIIFDQLKRFGFTVNMSIDYKKVVQLPDNLKIKAQIVKQNEKTVNIHGEIVTGSGEVASIADMTFFLATKKIWHQITGEEKIPELYLQYL